MVRQICNVKPLDVATVRSNKMLAQLEMDYLDVVLREKRLRWFGHVERFNGALKTVCNMQIEGKRTEAQDDMEDTYRQRKRDRREWKFNEVDPCDSDE